MSFAKTVKYSIEEQIFLEYLFKFNQISFEQSDFLLAKILDYKKFENDGFVDKDRVNRIFLERLESRNDIKLSGRYIYPEWNKTNYIDRNLEKSLWVFLDFLYESNIAINEVFSSKGKVPSSIIFVDNKGGNVFESISIGTNNLNYITFASRANNFDDLIYLICVEKTLYDNDKFFKASLLKKLSCLKNYFIITFSQEKNDEGFPILRYMKGEI